LTLTFIAQIKTTISDHHLELELPAAAASKLTLLVPETDIEISQREGSTLGEVVRKPERGSEIDLLGLGGKLNLAWRAKSSAPTPAILESSSQIFVQIDSRSVQFDAVLSVRSFSDAIDVFHVALPRGTQLLASAPGDAAYVLTASGDMEHPQVEVRLPQKTVGPIEVHIQAERAFDPTKPGAGQELGGFEIAEAIPHRQSGQIAVAIAGDLQPAWGQQTNVRQIAELPENLRRKNVVAGFEFSAQPASLMVRLAPRKTRVTVEPEYLYFVEGRQIRMEAHLKYAIRGAKTNALEIAMPGWEIDDVGPSDLVDAETVGRNSGPVFSIPLLQFSSGEFEIKLAAHRELPSGTGRIEIALPVLAAETVAPAIVAVVPADNIHLQPREDEFQGLVRPTLVPRIKLPLREQAPLIYRSEQNQALFVADTKRLPQVVHTSLDANLEVRRDEIRVEQIFKYNVEHEPISSITLDFPAGLSADARIEFLLDGQPLSATTLVDAESAASGKRLELPLPAPRLGELELTARFGVPVAVPSLVNGSEIGVPLLTPEDQSVEVNRLTIGGEFAARVQPLDDNWSMSSDAIEPTNGGSVRPLVRLTAVQATPAINLVARAQSAGALGSSIVSRAWVQTWLSDTVRQDRAVYQFSTSADELHLGLPADVHPGNIEVRVDQQLQRPTIQANKLAVRLPAGNGNRVHVLELRYQIDEQRRSGGEVEAQLPKFLDNTWVERMYWQLVLPPNDYLISSPAELSPEFTWNWSGWGWSRRSPWEQVDLERWSGAAADAPLPEATNRYLFSITGNPAMVAAIRAAIGRSHFDRRPAVGAIRCVAQAEGFVR
jgi:hypothetical protein